MTVLLGIDGGGTKTLAAVADLEGNVLGTARVGPSNYQSVTEAGAAFALTAAIDQALQNAGKSRGDIQASAFGLAGFDGVAEAKIVRAVVERAMGARAGAGVSFVENDSLLILRAGTDDGVGVGVVAGTGNNCIGRARDGRRLQIGGMGVVSGDAGSAPDLALRIAAAAWRSSDGRAPKSPLVPAILAALGIDHVERLSDRAEDGRFPDADVRVLVGALFAAAETQDPVALGVIEDVALVLATNAGAAIDGLDLASADRVVVLGGAVLERYAALRAAIARHIPGADVRVVPAPPVAGALLWAHDALGSSREARIAFKARVFDTLRI